MLRGWLLVIVGADAFQGRWGRDAEILARYCLHSDPSHRVTPSRDPVTLGLWSRDHCHAGSRQISAISN